MRITNNMLINNMMNNVGNNLARLDVYQGQLSSGKKIRVPSDDPVVAARALKLRTDVSEVDQYKRNITDAQSWMDITETTLSSIGDLLQRARELAVEGANGSNTPDDTAKIASEVKQLKEQLIHVANTAYSGRYIFSGFKTDQKLIVEDQSSPYYGQFDINVMNNSNSINYEVGIGDNISVNVLGGDLFNNGGSAMASSSGTAIGNTNISALPLTFTAANDQLAVNIDGSPAVNITLNASYTDYEALAQDIQNKINTAYGGADITVTVEDGKLRFTSGTRGDTSSIDIDETVSTADTLLGVAANTQVDGVTQPEGKLINTFTQLINLLDAGDTEGISALLDDFDTDMNNLLRIRADVGARQNRLELTSNRLESDTVNFTKLMSENEDADVAETIMNLQNEENVYKASLAAGARIIQPTLVDFLT